MKITHYPNLTLPTNINSRWIIDSNATCTYVKLRKKHRRKSLRFETTQIVLRHDIKRVIHGRKKVDKMVFIKINNFYSAKDPLKRLKRQARDWEKYSKITHPPTRGLVSRIYKELNVTTKKNNNPIRK